MSRTFKALKTATLATVALSPVVYLNNSLYLKALAVKRASIAFYYEGKILLSYKINGINQSSHDYCAKTLATLFRKNKGPAIKLGQNLAQYHHVLPTCFQEHMEPFLQACPVTPYKQISRLFKKEIGKDLLEVFDYFEEDPVASASIAQVHRARLKDQATYVAVKIQHPTIVDQVSADIKVVAISTRLAEFFFPTVKVRWIDKDFRTNMRKEVDFKQEAKNIERIGFLFRKDPRVAVPRVYKELSSSRVITMSWEEGRSITDRAYRQKHNIKVREVAWLLSRTFNKQIFEFGFVHADPHSGNLFIRKKLLENGRSVTQLVLLDHGLYMDLDRSFVRAYSALWRGIFTQRKDLIRSSCEQLGIPNSELFTTMLTGREFADVMDSSRKYATRSRLAVRKGKPINVVNTDKVRSFVERNYSDMFRVFEEGKPELPLLMKIVDYLRSIDSRIGNPINNFRILFDYVYLETFKEYRNGGAGFWSRVSLALEYYSFSAGLFLMRFVYLVRNYLSKTDYVMADLTYDRF